MNTMDNKQESITLFAVPRLPKEQRPAAVVQSIALVRTPGEPDVMRIVIARDLSVPIESFTFRYRFSNLPIYTPDPAHTFNTYVYTEDDLNTSPTLTFNGTVAARHLRDGCSAYISEIKLTSGQILTYDPAEFKFILRPKTQQPAQPPAAPVPPPAAQPAAPVPAKAPAPAPAPQAASAEAPAAKPDGKGKRIRRTVILTLFIFTLLTEAIAGVYLYRYLGVKNSAEALMREARYNEAYKICADAEYAGLLQRVCEKASVHYFSIGDLESAYVYAYGAPEPFTDMIIDYAAQSVVSAITGEINENAFRVAKMAVEDAKFDAIIGSMSGVLRERGDYANALRVVSEIRSADARASATAEVFREALVHYISAHRYDALIAFIDEMAKDTTFDRSEADIVGAAIDCCVDLGDNAGILCLAEHYPDNTVISADKTVIAPDDPGIRAKFSDLYPLLTPEQKRAYHAKPIAVRDTGVTVVEAGRINGTEIRDAVSIEQSAGAMLVLHKNGSVTLIPDEGTKAPYEIPAYGDVVQIAMSDEHAVLLHAGGTVTAFGRNTEGQCNVTEWTDIAAIAAGQRFTVGLKTDGTVVAVGSDSCGQLNVSDCRNVVDVAACNQTTVMLFADGTIGIRGYRSMGLADAETITGIVRIDAAGAAILTENTDGRFVIFSGHAGGDSGDPYNWRGITAFDVGPVCIAGVDKNGVLFTDGDGLPES